ncbi:MAG: LuxR C-terminal-related transcriptional regulator [Chitinophagaceae bacterium]|nr:LuxR C-terminal-related transcriptional regulator [Chitinophagaceae bacterium]
MEFKKEQLVEREIEIAGYLLDNYSISKICEKTGLGKKHLAAHIRNMMEKLGVEDLGGLQKILKNVRLIN